MMVKKYKKLDRDLIIKSDKKITYTFYFFHEST
jgi:hypothetical protein